MTTRSHVIAVLLHLISVLVYGYSIVWMCLYLDIPTRKTSTKIGGQLKYLTFWDLCFQFVTFAVCLATDVIVGRNTSAQYRPLLRLRDVLFTCLALPFGLFVETTFWLVYAIDRSLVYPVWTEKYYPIWLNHTTHTIMAPILLAELYLVCHKRPSIATAMAIIISVMLVYFVWILYIYLTIDYWVYAFLRVLNWPLRIALFTVMPIWLLLLYLIANIMSNLFWGTDTRMSVRSYPFAVLLHLLAVLVYGYSILWMFTHVDIPTRKPSGKIGGRLKYLTYWDLWFQFVTFAVCLLSDLLFGRNTYTQNRPLVLRLRDCLFSCVALPFGLYVGVSFWSIYAIDRELIFPVSIAKYYPNWLNHSTHSIIVPIVLAELYLVAHKRPSLAKGVSIMLSVIVVYLAWILYIALSVDYWVYPILEVLSWPLRITFIIASAFFLVALYLFGELLNNFIWGAPSVTTVEINKKSK